METKFKDLQNLYEVRKTVRFELKPSKTTEKKLIKKDKIFELPTNILFKNKIWKDTNYSKEVFKDLQLFLGKSKNILDNLKSIKCQLNANLWWQIFVKRDIFEAIDKNFYRNIKKKLSGWRSVSFWEIKNNWKDLWSWVEKIIDYFAKLLEKIENLQIDLENTKTSWIALSKNEIKRSLRGISLEFIRINNFFNNFDTSQEKFDWQIKKVIEDILKFQDFFDEVKWYYFMSENGSSWTLLRRFWFNERALKRRQPKEIQDELENLRPEFEKKEQEKHTKEQERQKLIETFELNVKQKQFQDLLHPEKWEYIAKKEKKERTEDEQNYWLKIKEWRNVVKKLRENDIEIEKLTNELNQIKKDYWNLRVQINNKEKELENNLALTHYAKLLKRNQFWVDFYYLVLIPINEKDILEISIWKNWDTEILNYQTLTFNAFKKLALSYDGTMWWYFDRDSQKFIIKDKPDEKDFWDFLEVLKNEENWENTEWFYNKKFNEKYQNYQKSPFEKLKYYIQNIIINNKNTFSYINFVFSKLNSKQTLNEYILEFDKQGYKLNWDKINFERIMELEQQEKLEIYQIYCKDFFREPDFFEIEYSVEEQKIEKAKRLKEIPAGWKPNLFTVYWEDFVKDIWNWSQNVRLNSDSWYFVKLADENVQEDGFWKSRKRRNKIIWTFNLSLNANKLLNNSFKEEKNIKEFNEIYNEKIKPLESLSYIWLDRWEKELLTYCVLNSRWEYIKDENWEYLIWDFNLINSKWEFVKKEDCEFKDSSKIYKYEQLIWTFLPDFSHWEQNIVEWKKKFQEDESWYFFNLDQNAKFYLAEWGYKIVNKNWEEINYFDKNWNKVYDYYLIFQSEIYKRYILNKTWSITLSEVQKFRWWYISNIIKVLNNWILKYNGVLILENLWKQLENKESNKENILQKTFWITIYQEIETLLNRKYNYFVEKRELSKFQLTPKVKNVWDIKLTEKENININLWNLVFIDEFLTSKECPNCWAWLHRNKKWWDNIYHDENNPWKNWCDFDTREKSKNYWFDFIKSWDDLAAYNIAKRWIEYLKNPTRIVLKDEKKTEKYSDNSHPKLSSNENPMAMDTPFKDLKF